MITLRRLIELLAHCFFDAMCHDHNNVEKQLWIIVLLFPIDSDYKFTNSSTIATFSKLCC